jgi:flavin reductase (DIM6/NTAB) family NADH-FMN oxidoreductase RutF
MVIDPKTLSSREAYNLLVSAVVPRPIAFITSMNVDENVNAAPYSFFNAISSSPPLVIISVGRKNGAMKHTAENILRIKEFVVNIVTEQLLQSMNISSADFPPGISEIEQSNLTLAPSISIRTPRIAESPVQCECLLHRHMEVGKEPVDLIIGEIVQFHIKDELISSGTINQESFKPIARMGGNFYSRTSDLFELQRFKVKQKE